MDLTTIKPPMDERLSEHYISALKQGAKGEGDPSALRGVINDVLSWLLALGEGVQAEPPPEFWATELGSLLLAADLYASADELLSQQCAAELAGVTIYTLHAALRTGRLHGYQKPGDERTYVKRSEVARTWKK